MAKFPSVNTGISRPSWVVPTMDRSFVPTMKSTWVMDSFSPRAVSSARVSSRPSFRQGYASPKAMWQAAFSSNRVL